MSDQATIETPEPELTDEQLDAIIRDPIPRLVECAKQWGLEEDALKAAVVCQLGLLRNQDLKTIQEMTGYDEQFIKGTVELLIFDGIWGKDGMCVTWPEDETGFACLCDCLVAAGRFRRFNKDDSDYYALNQEGVVKGFPPLPLNQWQVAVSLMDDHNIAFEAAMVITFNMWASANWPGNAGKKSVRYWARGHRTEKVPDDLVKEWLYRYQTYLHVFGEDSLPALHREQDASPTGDTNGELEESTDPGGSVGSHAGEDDRESQSPDAQPTEGQ
jgi:hypothetical protein